MRPGYSGIEVSVQLTGPESQERYQEMVDTVEKRCLVLDSLGNVVPVRATFSASA